METPRRAEARRAESLTAPREVRMPRDMKCAYALLKNVRDSLSESVPEEENPSHHIRVLQDYIRACNNEETGLAVIQELFDRHDAASYRRAETLLWDLYSSLNLLLKSTLNDDVKYVLTTMQISEKLHLSHHVLDTIQAIEHERHAIRQKAKALIDDPHNAARNPILHYTRRALMIRDKKLAMAERLIASGPGYAIDPMTHDITTVDPTMRSEEKAAAFRENQEAARRILEEERIDPHHIDMMINNQAIQKLYAKTHALHNLVKSHYQTVKKFEESPKTQGYPGPNVNSPTAKELRRRSETISRIEHDLWSLFYKNASEPDEITKLAEDADTAIEENFLYVKTSIRLDTEEMANFLKEKKAA